MRRWGKTVVAATVLGALFAFPAAGIASNSSRGDDSSCKGQEQSSQSVRKTKSNDPKPSVSCPSIKVEKKAENDSYKQGDSIKWTVTITNTGDSDVKVTAKDKGVKLYGPGGSSETARKAAKARSKSSSPDSCDDVQQSSSKRTSKSLRKSKSEGCDKKEKCGGVIAPDESLVCTGYQEAEKCGTVKNTVTVTATGVKKDDEDEDRHYSSSKTSKSTKHTKHKKHGVVVKASDETFVFCEVQDLAVTKTATTKISNEWSIVKSSKSGATINPAADSQPITYGVVLTKTPTYTVSGKVTVTNPNPFAVTGVNVTDSIPGASCTVTSGAIGTLNAGASAEATYACTVGSSADGTNTASVAWTDPANVVHNQQGPASYTFTTATLVHDAVNVSDVFDGQAATSQAGNVSAGGPILDYVKNAAMTGVALDGNGCRNVVNTATLTATDDAGYTQNSSVTVTLCKPAGGVLGGPSAVAGTTGTPTSRAALRLSKTGPGAATAGQLVTYRIKVTNRSKIAARSVVLRDLLPSGFSVSGKVKGAGINKGRVTWKVGSLAAGKSKTVIVKLRIDRNVGGRRCNKAVATAGNATTVRDSQCTRIAAVAGALQPAVTG